MNLLPIRYTSDIDASTRFYRALGLPVGDRSRTGNWVELPAADGVLALHVAARDTDDTPAGRCELAFEADEPLEHVRARLVAAGFDPEPVVDESFGHSLGCLDPDGARVQVNANDRELYT